ncbi:MAG: hypothetical protein ACFFDO_01740 [Candidatus Thorarchaeota archaeon]
MSKKYEHRIKSLKDHKENKGKKPHRSKPKPYARTHKLSKEKNNFSEFRKKIEKSKKIW